MSAAKKEKEFEETLEESFKKSQNEPDFDLIKYKKNFSHLIDEKPLTLKEMEYLVDFLKVADEEMGEEMENPCLEACFSCDALFEKNQGVAVKVPFCDHRAHVECLRRNKSSYCSICGIGIRAALFSFVKSKKLKQEAINQAEAPEDTPDLDITVPS